MSDWQGWGLQAWNERLLSYFFERREDQQAPVTTLLVTSETLARVTGDSGADPEGARDAFINAVRNGIRTPKSLLENASNYQGWPNPPPRGSTPRFVAHLLFTCVAASESSDDLGNEDSFIARLRELTENQLPGNSLQDLPRLWANLARWLEGNEDRYRRLLLPNPGSFTRIGHTVKLAFPDRRDQKQLSDLLDRAGLAGVEPPVGRVLSAVALDRAKFRPAFQAAFDEFRLQFQKSGVHTQSLFDHRFWTAVREAALRGRGHSDDLTTAVRISLLADEQDDTLSIFAVADADARGAIDTVNFLDLPFAYGSWAFGLVPSARDSVDEEGLSKTATSILSGTTRLPKVSSQVDQGLLPFVEEAHGFWELAAREQLGEATLVLVRQDLLSDFGRLVCPNGRVSKSHYEGWVQVRCSSIPILSFAELSGTSLERAWILQESLAPVSIRLAGGVRADDGWLGVREVLPRVVAIGVSDMLMDGEKGRETLEKVDESSWKLPSRDMSGEITLVALRDGHAEARRSIQLVSAPGSEAFKGPVEPDAWIVEGAGATTTLSSSYPYADDFCAKDQVVLAERVAYLGADVGTFCVNPDLATWRVIHFGNQFIGARGTGYTSEIHPKTQVSDANTRSRWRTMLFKSAPSRLDPGFDRARRSIKGRAISQDLPKVDLEQVVPEMSPLILPVPSDRANRLVKVLAGRASSRSGVPWREWTELALRVLQVDQSRMELLTRAWEEAGLIDVASSARWRHQAVFARRPVFVGFKVGEFTGASLAGLVLPATQDEVRRAAAKRGALVEERRSVSEFVPSTVALRLHSVEDLEALGNTLGFAVRWLDLEGVFGQKIHQHSVASLPPEHYEANTRWPRWSLTRGEVADIEFRHFVRKDKDKPDFWVASSNGATAWSYSLNVARSWAAVMTGDSVLRDSAGHSFEANHAFMPLRLARAIGVMGMGRSGPCSGGSYRYPIGSPLLHQFVAETLFNAFDLSTVSTATFITGHRVIHV
ncbi:hypothetical protein [Lysobacter sp. ESA13C]|uniref:hypothetical protein n=1 Tax=Lysobacter sp. ESA13C TaxID=2862676 RepID=UPI001CBDEC1A|nr:hypothetical protein [Lysobacter sp. ESA13C]